MSGSLSSISRWPRQDPERGNEVELAALMTLYRRAIDRYKEAQGEVCPDRAPTNDGEGRPKTTLTSKTSASEPAGADITLPHQDKA